MVLPLLLVWLDRPDCVVAVAEVVAAVVVAVVSVAVAVVHCGCC